MMVALIAGVVTYDSFWHSEDKKEISNKSPENTCCLYQTDYGVTADAKSFYAYTMLVHTGRTDGAREKKNH